MTDIKKRMDEYSDYLLEGLYSLYLISNRKEIFDLGVKIYNYPTSDDVSKIKDLEQFAKLIEDEIISHENNFDDLPKDWRDYKSYTFNIDDFKKLLSRDEKINEILK